MRILLCVVFFLWPWALQAFTVGALFGTETPEAELARILASQARLRGHALQVKFYDPSGEPQRIFPLVRRAREEGVRFLLGPLDPRLQSEALTAAQAYRLPLILLSGDYDPIRVPDEPFAYIFRTGLSPRMAARVLLSCLSRKGLRRVGVLLSLNEVGREGLKWLKIYAWEARLRLTKVAWFSPEDTYLYPKFEELLSTEGVVVWCDRESALKVVQEKERYGLGLPFFFGPELADEEFLRTHPSLYGYPFPGTALFGRRLPTAVPLNLERAALVDALALLEEIAARGLPPTAESLEALGPVTLPGGLYYLTNDDHYGLVPESAGVFTYGLAGFQPYCPPTLLSKP
ncbi:ABC transporter substrate-binding protein [Thermosulfurimonas marina]|uniref:ABC transporter substrate-binding protein n=1 Tax=Thermosulfurimonas marina TaxID=2047767 RepID=A0A6H1WS51_9BACT|nr:ABC transporter substrate-binding protein [Thermosulfurimonas marina]QJA06023.1 ABC transporter substrate-binding protein [Thermosulfurimonas marina]